MQVKDLPNKSLQTLLLDHYGYREYDEAPDPFELIVALSYKVFSMEQGLAHVQNQANHLQYGDSDY